MKLLTFRPELLLKASSYPELKKSSIKQGPCPSACRYCQFYNFQGRRSGYCQKLGISVRSHWHSCPYALPPFAPSWEAVDFSRHL